jgi:hypothetical protein
MIPRLPRLLLGLRDGTMEVWLLDECSRVATKDSEHIFEELEEENTYLNVNMQALPEGRLVTATNKRRVKIRDELTLEVVRELPEVAAYASSLRACERLFAVSICLPEGTAVAIYCAVTYEKLATFSALDIAAIAFGADTVYLASLDAAVIARHTSWFRSAADDKYHPAFYPFCLQGYIARPVDLSQVAIHSCGSVYVVCAPFHARDADGRRQTTVALARQGNVHFFGRLNIEGEVWRCHFQPECMIFGMHDGDLLLYEPHIHREGSS